MVAEHDQSKGDSICPAWAFGFLLSSRCSGRDKESPHRQREGGQVNSPTLHLGQSTTWRGLHFADENGNPIPIEEAFQRGFTITPNDAPAVLSLVQNYVQTRELNHQ